MKIQCVICDTIERIDADSLLGKRLRNHPLSTYVCQTCHARITEKTEKRKREGKLTEPVHSKEDDGWL
ncbi:YlaI family protein [Caldalkalibacillus salinus]|uniref:YlaI family protein n=1 Tax=Caldalkalibacillus salinus TaxID=2803787 RepID=UPI00192336CB|nr:YlaI family protein [Caldalkalibacillus salinus]